MQNSNNNNNIPDSILRRDNGVWRNECTRRALANEQSSSQLVDINHQRVAVECLLIEAAKRDKVASPHGCTDQREYLWRSLTDHVLTSSEDDYQGTVAKLSSMMLWEEQRRRYSYAYYEDELYARRINQMRTLQKLESQARNGGCPFFLEVAPNPRPPASGAVSTAATTATANGMKQQHQGNQNQNQQQFSNASSPTDVPFRLVDSNSMMVPPPPPKGAFGNSNNKTSSSSSAVLTTAPATTKLIPLPLVSPTNVANSSYNSSVSSPVMMMNCSINNTNSNSNNAFNNSTNNNNNTSHTSNSHNTSSSSNNMASRLPVEFSGSFSGDILLSNNHADNNNSKKNSPLLSGPHQQYNYNNDASHPLFTMNPA